MSLAVIAVMGVLIALGSVPSAVGVPVIIAAAGVSIGGTIAKPASQVPKPPNG